MRDHWGNHVETRDEASLAETRRTGDDPLQVHVLDAQAALAAGRVRLVLGEHDSS